MTLKKMQFQAALLNVLLPGLGHVIWKELTFGAFIHLIMLLAAVLTVVSFIVQMPQAARVLLYSLPVIFYLFTFVDLFKTVKRKQAEMTIPPRRFRIFFVIALLFQLLFPVAPLNFLLRNRPDIFVVNNSKLAPFYHKGDVLVVNTLAYKMQLFFLRKPVLYSLPQRYDMVSYNFNEEKRSVGLVVGLPGEKVEVRGGELFVNGLPPVSLRDEPLVFSSDWPLTSLDSYSIMVASMKLGAVDKLFKVSLADVVGKVGSLW
jgi:signal peptidase I